MPCPYTQLSRPFYRPEWERAMRNQGSLRRKRVRLFGVDSKILDGLFHDGGLNLSVLQQLMERGQRDEARIHLEEIAQRLPAIAPSEAIGSKRRQATRDPFADEIGQSL